MERLSIAQAQLKSLYDELNGTLTKKLPATDFDNEDALLGLLEVLYSVEGRASRKKEDFKYKLASNLRSAIADVLLLLEGQDYKQKKQEMELARASDS